MRDYKGRGLLAGTRALITGGDSGIGRAVAVAFAKEGADVAIAYLSQIEDEDAAHTAELVKAAGQRCVTIRGDLAVELGFARLTEMQEEILWLCEASHVPAIWATQVLDTLARTGVPSRATTRPAVVEQVRLLVHLGADPVPDEVELDRHTSRLTVAERVDRVIARDHVQGRRQRVRREGFGTKPAKAADKDEAGNEGGEQSNGYLEHLSHPIGVRPL